jgi:hypothetical protein
LASTGRGFLCEIYVKGRALTHDPERTASYHTDSLIKLQISARAADLYKMSIAWSPTPGIRATQILLSA